MIARHCFVVVFLYSGLVAMETVGCHDDWSARLRGLIRLCRHWGVGWRYQREYDIGMTRKHDLQHAICTYTQYYQRGNGLNYGTPDSWRLYIQHVSYHPSHHRFITTPRERGEGEGGRRLATAVVMFVYRLTCSAQDTQWKNWRWHLVGCVHTDQMVPVTNQVDCLHSRLNTLITDTSLWKLRCPNYSCYAYTQTVNTSLLQQRQEVGYSWYSQYFVVMKNW